MTEEIRVTIRDPELSDDGLIAETIDLRQRLQRLDQVVDVTRPREGSTPPSREDDAPKAYQAYPMDPSAVNELLVALLASVRVVREVVGVVTDWRDRRGGSCSVTLEFQGRRVNLDGATMAQVERVAERLLDSPRRS